MHSWNSKNNTYLLEEYEALEYILLGDLRDLLEERKHADSRSWLRAVLTTLLETLPRKAAIQDNGGYMSDVLEEVPNWSDQVERLYQERCELFTQLRRLHRQVAGEDSYAEIAEEVRVELRDWMTRLTAHYRHERRLVQSAFNFDIGIGD